jgi:acyl carrier protein
MAHIALISALEDEFGICFEAEDIFSFTSYEEGKNLMRNRFGLEL